MAKNEYAVRLQMRKQMESELIQLWTGQLCLDVITLVLNDPEVMGKDVFGAARLQKVGAAFEKLYKQCSVGLSKKDVTASHVREQIDRRLRQIWGEGFESWEERYCHWVDRGI